MDIFDVLRLENKDFAFIPEFEEKLKESKNAALILFIGNSRAGKSQRLNQILTKKIYAKKPFTVNKGIDPVTVNFQGFGPLSLETIGNIHEIELKAQLDVDIFLIDCE